MDKKVKVFEVSWEVLCEGNRLLTGKNTFYGIEGTTSCYSNNPRNCKQLPIEIREKHDVDCTKCLYSHTFMHLITTRRITIKEIE